MSFYGNAQSTVLELLDQFGQQVIIKRDTGGSFDPVTGTNTPGTVEDYTATAILADYSLKESGIRNQPETLIQAGDKKVTVAAKGLDIVPRLKDRVVANGVEYAVHNIKEVNPAGTPVLYELQGRQ